jgi:uncharacterized protein (DUF342 family)
LLLVGVAIIVFFAVRIGVLPKKSIPLVIGAALAAIGIGVMRDRRAKDLHKHLKQKEAELKKREALLEELKGKYELSDQEAVAAVAKRDAELSVLAEEIIELRDQNEAERKQLEAMTPAERREYVLNMKFD